MVPAVRAGTDSDAIIGPARDHPAAVPSTQEAPKLKTLRRITARSAGVSRGSASLFHARPWPFYPLLVGSYFVLFLYSVNLEETELADVLPVLAIVIAVIAVVLLGLGLLIGDVRRAALVLTVGLVALLGYGHAAELLAGRGIGRGIQQIGWIIVIGVALLAVWRIGRWLAPTTRALNLFAVVLLIVPLTVILPHQVELAVASAPRQTASVAGDPPPSADAPDIYYLVFDRYPGQRSIELGFDIENPLYDELRARGFYLADRSRANYQKTTFSLNSTMSAELLDGRGRAEEVLGTTDTSAPYSRIRNSNVARFLKARGYYYVHVGSDFDGTRTNALADFTFEHDITSDFGRAFIESTALPGILRRVGVAGAPNERRYHWTTRELDLLEHLPDRPGPEFVFGHVLLPHPPYIFEADGDFISDAQASRMSRAERWENQLMYTNKRLLAIVDHLLDRPESERPLIILQSDEGPYPANLGGNTGIDWTTATPEEREIKFSILNAWYVPDGRDIGLYPQISSVNTFRLLFNAYFGTTLPLLPDDSFTRGKPEPLEFPP